MPDNAAKPQSKLEDLDKLFPKGPTDRDSSFQPSEPLPADLLKLEGPAPTTVSQPPKAPATNLDFDVGSAGLDSSRKLEERGRDAELPSILYEDAGAATENVVPPSNPPLDPPEESPPPTRRPAAAITDDDLIPNSSVLDSVPVETKSTVAVPPTTDSRSSGGIGNVLIPGLLIAGLLLASAFAAFVLWLRRQEQAPAIQFGGMEPRRDTAPPAFDKETRVADGADSDPDVGSRVVEAEVVPPTIDPFSDPVPAEQEVAPPEPQVVEAEAVPLEPVAAEPAAPAAPVEPSPVVADTSVTSSFFDDPIEIESAPPTEPVTAAASEQPAVEPEIPAEIPADIPAEAPVAATSALLEQQMAELNSQLEAERAERAAAQQALEESRHLVAELQQQGDTSQLESELSIRHQELETMKSQLAQHANQAAQAIQDRQSLMAEFTMLQQKATSLETQMAQPAVPSAEMEAIHAERDQAVALRDELQTRADELQQEAARLQAELDVARGELDVAKGELDVVKGELDSAVSAEQNAEAQQAIDSLNSQLRALETAAQASDEEYQGTIAELETKVREHEDAAYRANVEKDEVVSRLYEATERRDELEAELENIRENLAAAAEHQAKAAELETQQSELVAQMQAAVQRTTELESTLRNYEAQLATAETELTALTTLREEIEQANAHNVTLQQQIEQLNADLAASSALEPQLTALQSEQQQLLNQMQTSLERSTELEEEIRVYQSKLTDAETSLSELGPLRIDLDRTRLRAETLEMELETQRTAAVELEALKGQHEDTTAALVAVQQRAEEAEAANKAALESIASLQAEQLQLKLAVEDGEQLRIRLTNAEQTRQQLQETEAALRIDYQQAQVDLEAAMTRVAKAEAEMEALRDVTVRVSDDQADRLGRERDTAIKAWGAAEQRASDLQTQFREQEAIAQRALAENERMQRRLADVEGRHETTERTLADAERRAAEAWAQARAVTNSDTPAAVLQQQLMRTQQRITDLEHEKLSSAQWLREAQEQIRELQNRLQQSSAVETTPPGVVDQLNRELYESRARAEELQQQVAHLESTAHTRFAPIDTERVASLEDSLRMQLERNTELQRQVDEAKSQAALEHLKRQEFANSMRDLERQVASQSAEAELLSAQRQQTTSLEESIKRLNAELTEFKSENREADIALRAAYQRIADLESEMMAGDAPAFASAVPSDTAPRSRPKTKRAAKTKRATTRKATAKPSGTKSKTRTTKTRKTSAKAVTKKTSTNGKATRSKSKSTKSAKTTKAKTRRKSRA